MSAVARPVFFVSDGTGITAETIGHSVLTQFSGVEFVTQRIAFVDTEDKAKSAAERIRRVGEQRSCRPIVVNTIVDAELSRLIADSGALMLDVFEPFIEPLRQELGVERQPRVGQAHGLVNLVEYEARISATNYAMSHDDGIDLDYNDADVILVGVSRSGKTPTCLYLALHFGIRAANYPLTDDDLGCAELPKKLRPHRRKLFGLTIDPLRLQQVRHARRPNSRYATEAQCRLEVAAAETLFRQEAIPMLNSTHTSIEEIASKLMSALGIEREMF